METDRRDERHSLVVRSVGHLARLLVIEMVFYFFYRPAEGFLAVFMNGRACVSLYYY